MDHVKEELPEYLDGELAAGHARRVESHLQRCSGCRAELEELRSLNRMVADMPRRPLPRGFLARLEARRRQPQTLPFATPLTAAAFALSSLLMIFVIHEKFDAIFPVTSGGSQTETARLDRAELEQPPASAQKLASAKGAPLAKKPAAAPRESAPLAAIVSAPPAAAISNEDLQKKIEAEKRQLGLKILPKAEPRRFAMGSMASDGASSIAAAPDNLAAALQPPPAAVAVVGPTPALLSPGGVLLRSPEEQAALWRQHHMKVQPPRMNYAKEMIVVVFSEDAHSAIEIDAIKPLADKILVQYRLMPLPEGTTEQINLPYQYRVMPRADLPVSFEKLP